MVWLGTVLILGTIVLASVVGGVASAPMDAMIRDEVAAGQPAADQTGARVQEDCQPAGMTRG
jgi:hypothetical protein